MVPESNLDNVTLDYEKNVSPGKPVKFTATVPLSHAKNGTHYIILQMRLPLDIQKEIVVWDNFTRRSRVAAGWFLRQ